jgi:act minimal PKS acyl carrier protein
MSVPALDLSDLRRILRAVAGTEQGVDLDADIMDTEFVDLGYDSLALMETAAQILQEFGVRLDDDAVFEATNPRRLLELVNSAGSRT